MVIVFLFFMNPKIENKRNPLASQKYFTKNIIIFFGCCLYFHIAIAQDSTLDIQPSKLIKINLQTSLSNYLTKKQINRRVKIIAAANVVGYSGAMVGLYAAWYKDYPQSNLHSFNDMPEWKGMDKMGHVYSVYAESLASMELWRWTGVSRKKRIWIGGLSGPVYHTVIEVLDGFSAEWGWSWADIGANFLGSGMLIAQELAWDEQRIQLKFSFHRKHYNDPDLNQRSNKIFGNSTAERFLKDYNGQTYWLSTNVRSFFPESKWPAWLNVAVGTGAEGMFGAFENIGKDENGNINLTVQI